MTHAWQSMAMRWLKFNLVGGIGIAVQLPIGLAEDGFSSRLPVATLWRSKSR